MRRVVWVAASFAIALSGGCNCGGSRIKTVVDGGHPYARVVPAGGLAAGATKNSSSEHFQLVGDVNGPTGTSSRSQHFQLKGGVVGASQE